jgi:hypothetical protein
MPSVNGAWVRIPHLGAARLAPEDRPPRPNKAVTFPLNAAIDTRHDSRDRARIDNMGRKETGPPNRKPCIPMNPWMPLRPGLSQGLFPCIQIQPPIPIEYDPKL